MVIFQKIYKSKLFKHTFIYTVINIIDKTIPFLIIPILTRIISKEEIGYYTLYQTLFNILIPLLTLSIDNSIVINFYKKGKDDYSKYFSTGIFFSIFIYLVGVFFGGVFSEQISLLFGLPTFWVQITMVIVLLQLFSQLRKNIWRISRNPLKYGYFSLPLTLSKNLLGLVFVLIFEFGWEGIILGHLVAQIFFSIYSIFSFKKEGFLKRVFSKSDVLDLIKLGGPISIHRIGAWLSNALNKVFLNMLLGATATGSYGVAATMGVIVTVIGDAITKAYVPFLYEKLKDFNQSTSIRLVKLIYGYYGFYLFLTIAVILVGYFGIGIIFGQSYESSKFFVFPLVAAATLNGLYKLHVDFISFSKKTYFIAATTIISGLVNIGLSYYMISNFGIIGAAYSALIIQLLTFFAIFVISNKQFKLPWLFFISSK